jgi:hypothetical protein
LVGDVHVFDAAVVTCQAPIARTNQSPNNPVTEGGLGTPVVVRVLDPCFQKREASGQLAHVPDVSVMIHACVCPDAAPVTEYGWYD